MSTGRNIDDPGRSTGPELRQQQVAQEKVGEMVDCELHLQAVNCDLPAPRYDARVIDQDMQFGVARLDLQYRISDRSLRREISSYDGRGRLPSHRDLPGDPFPVL